MEYINWMNLSRQFNNHEDEFMEAIHRVCKETAFSGGKYVMDFEKAFANYCNVKASAGVSSGTDALTLAMKALGIKAGDEVIVPADTFIASAWGVSHNGAIPVFVDINPDTFNIDINKIEEKITDKTKAIVGVHLYGQPFDIDGVSEIAKKHNLYLIEDCAQAHGALYKNRIVGGLSNAGCFSFYPGKNLGAFGEGGAVTANDEELIEKINVYKNQGSSVRYYHDVIGYNLRLDGIQGAVLSLKLKYIDEWTKARQNVAQKYFEGIKNDKIKMQEQPEWAKSVFHLFVVEVDDREKFRKFMDENDIGTGVHYPVPCHLQKAYENLGYKKGDLPFAEYHCEHCVSLPMYPELKDDEIAKVIEICNKYE